MTRYSQPCEITDENLRRRHTPHTAQCPRERDPPTYAGSTFENLLDPNDKPYSLLIDVQLLMVECRVHVVERSANRCWGQGWVTIMIMITITIMIMIMIMITITIMNRRDSAGRA